MRFVPDDDSSTSSGMSEHCRDVAHCGIERVSEPDVALSISNNARYVCTIVRAAALSSDFKVGNCLSCRIELTDISSKTIAKPDDTMWIYCDQVWACDQYRINEIFCNGDVPCCGRCECGDFRDPLAVLRKPDVSPAINGNAIR